MSIHLIKPLPYEFTTLEQIRNNPEGFRRELLRTGVSVLSKIATAQTSSHPSTFASQFVARVRLHRNYKSEPCLFGENCLNYKRDTPYVRTSCPDVHPDEPFVNSKEALIDEIKERFARISRVLPRDLLEPDHIAVLCAESVLRESIELA